MGIDAAVFDALPTAVLVVRDGCVAWSNAAFGELVGERAAALAGLNVGDLVLEAEREIVMPRLLGASHEGSARSEVIRVTLVGPTTGERREIEADIVPTASDELLVQVRDVTAVARTERLISSLSSLYVSDGGQAMVDLDTLMALARPVFIDRSWFVVLWEVLPDEVAVLRHTLTPKSAEAPVTDFIQSLHGRRVPLSNAQLLERVARDGAAGYATDIPKIVSGIRDTDGEWDARAKTAADSLTAAGFHNGAWAPVRVGKAIRYVMIFAGRDLREGDLAAVQLFAAQVAATVQLGELSKVMVREQRLAALGQMSALLAHEVRNPLAVMFQAHAQVRKRVGDAARIGDLMDIVEEETRRLDKLVNDLVNFAGPSRPQLEALNLRPVVHWAVASARENPDFDGCCVEIEVDVPSSVPAVRADPLLLRQAMTHLLANACHHVRRGGHVRIVAAVDGAKIRVRVQNDGHQLADDVAGRVFEPFFTTKAMGSGLGLAVVRRLIEDQGGTVTLDPDGPGVSFSVWLHPGRA